MQELSDEQLEGVVGGGQFGAVLLVTLIGSILEAIFGPYKGKRGRR